MNLGTQYYRAPFPESQYWEDDLARMRDAGLNTVQLWVVWGWIEPAPDEFRFDDYDRLVELAGEKGLGVVLSTIAAIHPYWIHREVPDSEMVDHMGRKVVSSNRGECHFGLTPGGCTDHPGVWRRMEHFLKTVAERYRKVDHLRGWDAWNELRWNVQSDGLVCFCDHTVRAFRSWLEEEHGSLDGLNRNWKRRYASWKDVSPGKLPNRPFTEMMAFEHFITVRANRLGKARCDTIKAVDPDRPVTVHAGQPCPLWAGNAENHPVNRGNDWGFADQLDGIGCSSFPKWQGMDDADFGIRVEFVKSAARDKRVWLSEVQGGRAAHGFTVHEPVDALSQQRWIWNGFACGADTILFWCWRDEVFGRESGGFGLTGADGLAGDRLEAMKKTGALLEKHEDLLTAYEPCRPEVGVLFSPQTYYLNWALEGSAGRAATALRGYMRALVRLSIPVTVVEEDHLEALDDLRILFLPRLLVTSPEMEDALEDFVRNGGTLVCESECGAFDRAGLYRYPQDRFLQRLAGVREVGRRTLTEENLHAALDGRGLTLAAAQWLTPWLVPEGEVWCEHPDGALLVRVPAGKGTVVLIGSYLGDAYLQRGDADFESLLKHFVQSAGWTPRVTVTSPRPQPDRFVYIKHGDADGRPLLFVFFPNGVATADLRLTGSLFPDGRATDLISGQTVEVRARDGDQTVTLDCPDWRFAVLTTPAP